MQRVYQTIKYLVVFIFTIFLPGILLTACQQSEGKQKPPAPIVAAIKAVKHTVPLYKNYIGTTTAVMSVDIRARVKGFLVKRNFVPGSFIKKGQLLFEIDPKPFQVSLKQAKSELANAIAEANFQQVEFIRMKELYAKQVISKEKYDQTNTSYKQALAQIAVEQANVDNAKINLGYCYMYSSISGKIGTNFVDVGNLVGGSDNTMLATVVTLNPIYVEFSPSISDFGEFLKYKKPNKEFSVKVTLPKYPELTFYGKVDLVNNEADQNTGTILMRATVNNPKKLLLPGIYVNVKMIIDPDFQAITVPEEAIMQGQNLNYVYIINQNDIVEQKNVTTGTSLNNQRVILSGLKPGEIVITSELKRIRPGEKIKYRLKK